MSLAKKIRQSEKETLRRAGYTALNQSIVDVKQGEEVRVPEV